MNMYKKVEPTPTYMYVLIGGALIVLLKLFVFEGRTPFQDMIYDALHAQKPVANKLREGKEDSLVLFEPLQDGSGDIVDVVKDQAQELSTQPVKTDISPKNQEKSIAALHDSVVRVAIIIDDVGVNRRYSFQAIQMDAGLTLAFLPYATHLKQMTEEALVRGHELMIHIPMEAMDQTKDLGPNGLRMALNRVEFDRVLKGAFESFDGYVGLNNHMGSRLTQDEERMSWVMSALQERGLYFVDSKTIHNSVAGKVAQRYGVAFAERHVFLDHNDELDAVRKQLKILENSARSRGYAIAIGHPKKNTLQAIAEWLPSLEKKGIVLVPVSALVHNPQNQLSSVEAEEQRFSVVPSLEDGFSLGGINSDFGVMTDPENLIYPENSLEHFVPPLQ